MFYQMTVWPHRSFDQFAATVRANVAEIIRSTVRAECAFETADSRQWIVWREIKIATLAIRFQF